MGSSPEIRNKTFSENYNFGGILKKGVISVSKFWYIVSRTLGLKLLTARSHLVKPTSYMHGSDCIAVF